MNTAGDRPLRRLPISRVIAEGVGLRAPWGYVGVTPREIARMQGRLSASIHVYPPGMKQSQRRLIRLRQLANSWLGVTVALVVVLACVFAAKSVPVGLAIAVAVLAAAYAWLMLVTRRAIAQVRTVRVSASQAGVGDTRLFDTLGEQLDSLDRADYSPVQYEAEWWRIYSALKKPNKL